MPHEVFICYASQDKAVAEAVCDALEAKQIKCWIAPRDVLPGVQWAESIVDAIDSSRAIVLVLSANSNISPQVIREVGRAAGKSVPIIPFRIDDVIPSKAMDYFVSGHHWLDAQTDPLEKHLKRLVGTVQNLLTPGKAEEKTETKEKAPVTAERPARREAKKPLLKQWWFWVGATVVVAVIPLIVILSGGTGEEPPPGGEEPPPSETEETPSDGGVVAPLAKDGIIIGAARPLTGYNTIFDETCFGPIYRMWVEEVNAAGGIYVEEYGQQLPIELLVYDDTSDIYTMERLTKKLILEDNVDILFSAATTEFIAAQAPIANEHGYVLITADGGSTDIRDMISGLPYVFATLSFSDWYQLPVLAEMLAAKGVETAYIVRVDDAFGAEYSGVAVMEFARVGIDIVGSVGVPVNQEDFSSIIEAAKAADPDVFCVFAFPDTVLRCTFAVMEQGFNPDAFIVGPGGNFGFYPTLFSDDVSAVDGVLTFAAANEKTSDEFAELFGGLEPVIGAGNLDYWGHPFYRSVVQIWQQAIESTGTLNQDVLRDYIATSTFDTILGPTWFIVLGDGGGILAYECHPGEIGQWQNGVLEIVGGGDWSRTVLTAEFIYPKPDWPR